MPDTVEFLEWLRPGGPWLLVRIHPESERIVTLTASAALAIEAFVKGFNGKWNLYYGLNPTHKAMDKKPTKGDIAWIEFLFGDLDPDDDETPEAGKERYLAAIRREVLAGTLPQPSAIEDSGNGLQPLWRLSERLPATPENVVRVEALCKAIMVLLGAKAGTQNIDRILRLPFTTNLPNKSKLAKGRVACEARIIL